MLKISNNLISLVKTKILIPGIFLFCANAFASEGQVATYQAKAIKQIIFPQLHYSSNQNEGVLESQFRIYSEIKLLNQSGRRFAVFVEHAFFEPKQSNLERTIQELNELVANASLEELPKESSDSDSIDFDSDSTDSGDFYSQEVIQKLQEIIEILQSGSDLSKEQLEILGTYTHFSPFNVEGASFEEGTLINLRDAFPKEFESLDELNEDQKSLFLHHGAVALLAALGQVKNLQKTENLEVHRAPMNFVDSPDGFRKALMDDREQSVVSLIKKYQASHPDDLVVLVYGAAHPFQKYFAMDETVVIGDFKYQDLSCEPSRMAAKAMREEKRNLEARAAVYQRFWHFSFLVWEISCRIGL